ncbi:MAG TPA: hypothetical protein VI160_10820 [Gemmatimonadales bacterium]
MRPSFVGLLSASLLLGATLPARGQVLSLDARRVGLGGLSLHRSGNLSRFNAAYRAVPKRNDRWHAKFTIPIPLGIIQVLKDTTVTRPDSSYFNPIQVANYVFNLPVFYEVKKAPVPTNDVTFTIGRNAFGVDLGAAKGLVPTDPFGIDGSGRPMDIGFSILGVRASTMVWMQDQVDFQLGPNILAFLHDGQMADTNTLYDVSATGLGAAGFAPTLGWAGRVSGADDQGIFIGANAHYYFGVVYGQVQGTGGFTTGDTLFAGSNPVTPSLGERASYSKFGNKFGTGMGADIGAVWIKGPLEVGFGINDVGAKITWPDTRVDSVYFDGPADSMVTVHLANHVQTTTKLPVAYLANASMEMGTGTTVGADILHTASGTQIHVGAEQRVGPLALRGGVARDQRSRLQFGWGGGVRFLFMSLDVGFATHSNSFSTGRGITMATSLSIY